MDLQELLQVDQRAALQFFFSRLRDVSEPSVDEDLLLYNASVLAHYTQISTDADHEWPVPSSLSPVFDNFVLDTSLQRDSCMMEVAGAQCLLLAGFFENQMWRRHNIRWYSKLGTDFFNRAATQERSLHKARLLDSMSRDFEPWRQRYALLSRELQDHPYLLSIS